MLAYLIENDPEGADWLRESLDAVNTVLAEKELPAHIEPERLPNLENRAWLQSFPYPGLHQLRRIAAYAAEKSGWVATPFPDARRAATDPILEKHSARMTSHLLCHSDCEGFYLPILFEEVIVDEDRIPGAMLGSSFMLMRELAALAPALQILLHGSTLQNAEAEKVNREVRDESPLWMEKGVWLCLYEAARLSTQHKTAICFS
jgi:hypothetical protein